MTRNETHLKLARSLVNVDETKVHRLGVVRHGRLGEHGREGRLCPVRVFEVEQRDPNVQLLLLLPEIDRLQRPRSNLACLLELRQSKVVGDELNPEERRVGRTEEESFKVGEGSGSLRCEVASLVLESRETLLGHGSGDDLLLFVR